LVADSAGGFAGRLAGYGTLAATAFQHGLFQLAAANGLDMLHDMLLCGLEYLNYT
jgi:hypothetical protein